MRLLGPERPPPSGSLSIVPTATALPDFRVGHFVAPKARGPFSCPFPRVPRLLPVPTKARPFRRFPPPTLAPPLPPSAGVTISPIAQAGSGSVHLPGVDCPRGMRLSRAPKCPPPPSLPPPTNGLGQAACAESGAADARTGAGGRSPRSPRPPPRPDCYSLADAAGAARKALERRRVQRKLPPEQFRPATP